MTADYKSRLQEWAQKQYKTPPTYILKNTVGPDHAKVFEMDVMVHDQLLGSGSGKSKKEAEQVAARNALKQSKSIE